MASTRTHNTPGNYCVQQHSLAESRNYLTYVNSANGQAFDPRLPGNGLLPGQVPMNTFSHNPADIESFLWGINSTNLVSPQPCLVPEFKTLHSANIFEKEVVWIPEPLVIESKQRTFPIG